MIKQRNISAFQLFSILFSSRILIALTFVPSFKGEVLPTDQLIQVAFWLIGTMICALPIYFLLRGRPDSNLFTCAAELSPVFSRILAAGYACVFLYSMLSSISRFELFSTSVLFPEANSSFFILLLMAVCAYAAILGLEAIGRASLFSSVLILGGLSFIFVTLIPKTDLLNFTPLFYDGVKPALSASVYSVAQTMELGALAIVFPRAKSGKKRSFLGWLLLLSIVMALIVFFTAGVLGNYAKTQLFPVYALATMAEFSVLQRLDALLTGIWIFSVLIRISFFLCVTATCMEHVLGKKCRKTAIVGSTILVSAVSIFVSYRIERFSWASNGRVYLFFFCVLVLAVPLLILLINFIKRKRVRA